MREFSKNSPLFQLFTCETVLMFPNTGSCCLRLVHHAIARLSSQVVVHDTLTSDLVC